MDGNFNQEIERMFYLPVCHSTEIDRILNIQTIEDYLLKLRADIIVDNMRLFRVYRNKKILDEKNWFLEKSFSTEHYSQFLLALKPEFKKKCSQVAAGNIFSKDPNGQIFLTEKGPLITICDSLKFFFKFMHLGLLDFGDRVPEHVSYNSMRIAIRVMLKTEALDFFMDPRGIVPADVAEEIHAPIPYQLRFIAGHEYAHYVLGHLDRKSLIDKAIFQAIFNGDTDYNFQKIYSYSQKQEFEADEGAILLCDYNDKEKIAVFEAALLWFAALDIYEAVKDTISPPIRVSTHPAARERYENLLQKIKMPDGYDYKKWTDLLLSVDFYKKVVIEDVTLNIEAYEMYGSLYFDKPNTEWRGKELIDRVDYY